MYVILRLYISRYIAPYGYRNYVKLLGVAMALHEDYDSTQDQLQWLKHLDKERQNISASVEETLAVPASSQPDPWDEDAPLPDTSQKTALIRPRLSLQSKVLPAVRVAETDRSLTGSQQAVVVSRAQPATEPQPGQNVFKRIAQRLTAVFGSSDQTEDGAAEARKEKVIAAEQPRRAQTALLPAVSPLPLIPTTQPRSSASGVDTMPTMPPLPLYTPNEWPSGAKPTVVDAVPSARQPVMPAVPVRLTELSDADLDTGKQKLAGWNTKVRLQAVSLPSQSAKIAVKPIEEVDTKPDLSEMPEEPDVMASSHIQSEEAQYTATKPDTGKMEAVNVATPAQEHRSLHAGSAVGGRGSLSGTDVFESGQSECAVKNTNITATAVVLVMLTSNPGPVALHYISTQPQVGFTIHLTGPATMKTAFNYIILLGELF